MFSDHLDACLEVRSCVFMTGLTDSAIFVCMKRLGMAFYFGSKFPVGGSIPDLFCLMVIMLCVVCVLFVNGPF
jgi:hypothetical protein